MLKSKMTVEEFDPELYEAVRSEEQRQEEHIELIASENYTSQRVLAMQGSVLTNKYAEGYPHKRYYGGCDYVDYVEDLAISRAKSLFNADFANVQPHSGSQANAAVFMALLNAGDTILGMSLADGGHLTHGSKVSFSGKLYHAVQYGIDHDTGEIDYQQVLDLALEHQPKMIIAGFSAYSGIADWKKFREIADQVNAYLVVDMAHVSGLIAANLYPSPLPYAHVVTSTTHKTLAGPRGGIILSSAQDETLYKKLNSAVFPGGQGGPLCHVIAAKAVAFKEALQPEFKVYQQQVLDNAKAMAHTFIDRQYKIVSGGTHNHLFLLDLIDKNMTGKEADALLSKANITVNKNSVPNDPQSPFITSGLRIGTPAMTTRGMGTSEAEQITHWICDLLENKEDVDLQNKIKEQVIELCFRYPVYQR